MRPPSVALEGRIEIAKGVDETGAEEVFNSLALFFSEASVVGVVVGASEVEWGVCDVEIAANDDGFGEFEGFQVAKKSWVPDLFAELEPGEIAFAIWNISIDEIEVREFDGLDATLGERVAVFIFGPGIVFLDVRDEGVKNVEWLDFGENCGARIARAFGAVPDFEIFREVDFDLTLFGLSFLKTDNVGLFGVHKVEESAFFQSSAQAIDVPRIDFDMLFSIFHVRGLVF